MHYLAFDKNWFSKHQSKLIWLLNHKLTKRLFRRILCIENEETINRIEPNAYWFGAKKQGKEIEVKADFRTHNKYSKRLYFAFSPLWWTMHFLDWLFIDKYIPKLSFGFLTLTANPSAGAASPVDGYIQNTTAVSWASCRSAATGTTVDDTIDQTALVTNRLLSGTDWYINRSIFLFDTSALTASANISAAVLSVKGHDTATSVNTDSISVHVVSSSPASNSALVVEDFDQVGTTSFGSLALSGWHDSDGVYNDFTLDANGIANVSKTSISKFGMRGSLDLADSPTPTGNNQAYGRFADYAGTASDPKLVITYTLASPNHFLSLLGVGA